jgi:hypothetical protein
MASTPYSIARGPGVNWCGSRQAMRETGQILECKIVVDFASQEINAALKNLGHPIGNITSAFDNLKARKPAPVMQLKKSGTSKQARKTYRLTLAGKSAVEAMVRQH